MKLTNAIRESLLSNILRDKFKPIEESNSRKMKKIGDRIYNKLYPKKERDLMGQLPKAYFNFRASLKIQFRGSIEYIEMETRSPFGHCHKDAYNPFIIIEAKTSIGDAFEALKIDIDKIKNERADVRTKTNQVLYSINTDSQLIEAWPEVAKYLKPFQQNATRALIPVGIVKELNNKLELKSVNTQKD